MSTIKRKVFQAGFAFGENSWALCAHGDTIEAARNGLERLKHIDALKFISDFSMKHNETALDGKFLEKMYDDHIGYLDGHRYVESYFIDDLENKDDTGALSCDPPSEGDPI